MRRMRTRPKGRRPSLRQPRWWTRERVLRGLRRACEELYGGEGARLPRDTHLYAHDTAPHCAYKFEARRRYPPAHQIARHFPSLTHAWHELGLIGAERLYLGPTRWWTRARMIAAGAEFFRAYGVAPTNDAWWQEMTSGIAAEAQLNGTHHNRYPSCTTIQFEWQGMRAFWVDVKAAHLDLQINLDHTDMPWTRLEEWFVTESVGLLAREEVARLLDESGLGRTEAAIKRRLYDLGVNSYNRWGWTIHKIARVLGIRRHLIEQYIRAGELPCFRGAKCIYVDPADLTVIRQYNWAKRQHPKELERDMRAALMRRLCYILLGFDWRRYSYHHQARGGAEYEAGGAEKSARPRPQPAAAPDHIKAGNWVKLTGEWRFKTPGATARVGYVSRVYWSYARTRATQKSPARPAGWMAAVEMEQVSQQGSPRVGYRRTRYSIPLDVLERVRKPYGCAVPVANVYPERAGRKKGPKPTQGARAARLADLPVRYRCRLCGRQKKREQMVVVFIRAEAVYRMRPRCKECHNERERGHRREWKTEYLRRWRETNKELNDSYWKNPRAQEKLTRNARRRWLVHHDAILIQGRLNRKRYAISLTEAKELLRKFGPCYPTRFGLTAEGLRRCENLRSQQRRKSPRQPLTPLEIRLRVYDEGLFIKPSRQERPYQHASTQLRLWQQAQRERKEAGRTAAAAAGA